MKKDYLNSPILVTGAARSGTSMIGQIINMCGAFGGKMDTQHSDMCENEKILNSIVKPYLKGIGADPNGQYPIPSTNTLGIPISFASDVLKAIQADGYTSGPWMYKGTQMSLMHPIWHFSFPNAKWVIVRRRDDDIVESCLHTTYMKAFNDKDVLEAVGEKDTKDAWYWWVRQYNKRFVEMIENGVNCKQVHPERMLQGDYSQVYEMLEWLGLKWDSRILNFMERKLANTRKSL